MTVGELKEALKDVPDSYQVDVLFETDDLIARKSCQYHVKANGMYTTPNGSFVVAHEWGNAHYAKETSE